MSASGPLFCLVLRDELVHLFLDFSSAPHHTGWLQIAACCVRMVVESDLASSSGLIARAANMFQRHLGLSSCVLAQLGSRNEKSRRFTLRNKRLSPGDFVQAKLLTCASVRKSGFQTKPPWFLLPGWQITAFSSDHS